MTYPNLADSILDLLESWYPQHLTVDEIGQLLPGSTVSKFTIKAWVRRLVKDGRIRVDPGSHRPPHRQGRPADRLYWIP